MSEQHQRTRIADLTEDLRRASNTAYDHGYHRDGHLLERAALLIEDYNDAHGQALRLLEPAKVRSTAVCRAIDVLEGVAI